MNTNGFDEREWLAQERARIAARDAAAPAAGDPRAARYRRVAEALRMPLPDGLPADFAAQVARRAEAAAASPEVAEPRFERSLTRMLIGAFGLASAVVAAMYGAQWLPPILQLLRLDSAGAMHWALALGACVGASWLVDQLRRHHDQGTHAA